MLVHVTPTNFRCNVSLRLEPVDMTAFTGLSKQNLIFLCMEGYKHVGISRITNFEMILKVKPGTR